MYKTNVLILYYLLNRIFLPAQIVEDRLNLDPFSFNEYGLHMFYGEQGSGKTLSVVHLLMKMQKKYPKCKVRTNFGYEFQDDEVFAWQDLVHNENGEYGQIEVIDEIQTWFSSLNSKDFSPEMLGEISQQRKQRKMLVGTAQVFCRIAKPIREQTHFVYLPKTYFGCLTVVRVSKAYYYNTEKDIFTKYIKTYCFVHTKEIRNAYDTYKKIENYVGMGFQINPLISNELTLSIK